jgi:cytochrome c-type biogenesis protein CcmH
MRRVLIALALVVLGFAGSALAVEPDEVLPDPALEARARALSAELRCMVCQNQSIDDSNADLAKDLRVLLRERIKAGDTDDQVRNFLVARYGDFILLRPPVKPETILLWATAPVVLILGLAIALRSRRRLEGGTGPLSEAEQADLQEALRKASDPRKP